MKNSEKTPILIPQPNGGALLSGGMPGNAGGTGRPPKSFAAFMKQLREDPDVHAAIERAAKDPDGKGFGPVLNKIADYDEEKPAEKRQIVGPIEVRVRFEHEGTKTTNS